MRTKLNFNHLECFYHLANTLSFSQTSENLSIAQSAVSKQIKSLEDYFQCQLFVRSKKNVNLTSKGKEIYKDTFSHFQEIIKITDKFANKKQISGELMFGCLSEIGQNFFLNPLMNFKKKYSDISLRVRFLKGIDIIDGVKTGQIDLGIVSESVIAENIRSFEILQEELILVAHKKYSDCISKSLNDLKFVSYRENDPILNLYLKKNYPRAKRHRINVEFTVNSHRAMVDILASGPFCAVLPSLSVVKDLEKKKLVDIGPNPLKSSLYLIYADMKYIDEKVSLLSDEIFDFIKKS